MTDRHPLCASCRAAIWWAYTLKGNLIPVDVMPVDGGNLRRLNDHTVAVDPDRHLFDQADDGTRYVAHFATCPDAAEHRRRR